MLTVAPCPDNDHISRSGLAHHDLHGRYRRVAWLLDKSGQNHTVVGRDCGRSGYDVRRGRSREVRQIPGVLRGRAGIHPAVSVDAYRR